MPPLKVGTFGNLGQDGILADLTKSATFWTPFAQWYVGLLGGRTDHVMVLGSEDVWYKDGCAHAQGV